MPRNTLDVLDITIADSVDAILDCMIEVNLKGENLRSAFLCICETLTRVGLRASFEEKKLFQTCHILHKRGKYYIVHFKHMFILDGRNNGFTREDVLRMNLIAKLLESWKMIEIVHPEQITEVAHSSHIQVIRHADAAEWTLLPKYNLKQKF